MFGKHTLSNIKLIANHKPSLMVSLQENMIALTLYIDCKGIDGLDTEFENNIAVIGSIQAINVSHIDNKDLYRISGTVGAYPGFGCLMYEALLSELDKISGRASLISDRESVRGEAERIYQKMEEYKGITSIGLPVVHPQYSHELQEDIFDVILEQQGLCEDMDYDDYIDGIEAGKIEPYILNKAYSWSSEYSESQKILNILIKNHTSRNQSFLEMQRIEEDGFSLGDFVDSNRAVLENLRDNYFSGLTLKKELQQASTYSV